MLSTAANAGLGGAVAGSSRRRPRRVEWREERETEPRRAGQQAAERNSYVGWTLAAGVSWHVAVLLWARWVKPAVALPQGGQVSVLSLGLVGPHHGISQLPQVNADPKNIWP